MAKARELFPQHHAMLVLELATPGRPRLRPLRHKGPTADILWNEGVLLVRRSETRGEVMERRRLVAACTRRPCRFDQSASRHL